MSMTDYLEKTSEIQIHLCGVAKDCVALGRGDEERINKLVKQAIWESGEFKLLPKFRQMFVVGFVAGLQAGVMTPSLELPDLGKPVPAKEVPPKSVRDLQPGVTWRRHENGGGWKSETCYVEATALLGAKAVVFENARVTERSKIYGSARIFGDAECFGSCHVHGFATVKDRAQVFDASRVLGRVVLGGDVKVGGSSLIRGNEILTAGVFYDERVAPERVKNSYVRELGDVSSRKSG